MHGVITAQTIQNSVGLFLLTLGGFGLSMILTPLYTFFAYRYRLWQMPLSIAVTGERAPILAKLHAVKHARHIPLMAGAIFLLAATVLTLCFNFGDTQPRLLLVALLSGGAVGLAADILHIRGFRSNRAWLSPVVKCLALAVIGLGLALFCYQVLGLDSLDLPFQALSLGWWVLPLFVLTVVATSGAVAITDGVDGLAGGLAAMAFGFFGAIAVFQGNTGVAAFCFTLVGALIAYTWFNIAPARFLMSNIGSFALGTALSVVAILTKTVFLLPIIGFVFVADTASSVLQIISKQLFGRKILLSAPIHQHFQALGWPETKVTMRFWLIGQVSGTLGLVVALVGGFV